MIQIKTRKIVNDAGQKMREILSIDGCLAEAELPALYISGDHRAWSLSQKRIHIQNGSDIGGSMPEENFVSAIAELKRCGNALHVAKETLSKLKAEWQGDDIYEI